MTGGTNPVGLAIANRELRRAVFAYAASVVAEWSLWVGVIVYAYDHGGASAAGFTSIGLLIPSIVIAPITGRTADGARPIRLLFTVYAVQSVAYAAAGIGAFSGLPAGAVVALIAIATTAMAFVRPAISVVVPSVVRSASELTSANLLTGYVDSGAVLFGPLVAAMLLAIRGPALVFAVCAAMSILAMVAMRSLVRLDPPARAGTVQQSSVALRHCLRALARRPGAISLLTMLAAQYVLIGALDILYVVLAVEELDLSDSAAGVLSAMFGAGALMGGVLATPLAGRRRLAPLIMLGGLSIAVVMLTFGARTAIFTAVIALTSAGIGRSLIDVFGRMLLQRAAPQDALASVFAVMEALTGVGTVLGAFLVQISIAVAGPRAALVVLAAFFAAVLAVTARGLRHVDASADAPVVAIRHLRRIPIFAPLPGPALEGVARAAIEVDVPAGDVVIHQHAVGDRYFAITSGHVDFVKDGEHLRTLTRGSGFGEIALLADVPRTATATAQDQVTLLAIERVPFLTAVTGHDASARTAWSIAREWEAGLGDGQES